MGVQSGHYQQVAATAAILVEIKSSLEWVQGIWDWLFSADRLVICVRRLTRPFPFFLVANCEPGCGLIIKVRPWKVADTLVKKRFSYHLLYLLTVTFGKKRRKHDPPGIITYNHGFLTGIQETTQQG